MAAFEAQIFGMLGEDKCTTVLPESCARFLQVMVQETMTCLEHQRLGGLGRSHQEYLGTLYRYEDYATKPFQQD